MDLYDALFLVGVLDYMENNDPIHYVVASKECTLDDIMNIVRADPTALNSRNSSKATPLHCALDACQHSGIILKLLSLGADVSAKEEKNLTPLHIAIDRYNENLYDIVKILIQYGADVNCVDTFNRTPLHHLFKKEFICTKTLQLLLENGANTNATDMNSISILTEAFRSKGINRTHVKLLLEDGAKLTENDCSYWIHFKSYLCPCSIDVMKLIIQYSLVEEIMKIHYLELEYIEVEEECNMDNKDVQNFLKEIMPFKKSLINELISMKKYEINENKSLLSFISDSCSGYSAYWNKELLLNKVLTGLSFFNFLCSYDIIEASLKNYDLLPKLYELDIYVKKFDSTNSDEKKIMLNYDAISYLASYLSKEDVMNLVLAYWSKKKC